jgi:hypothetical protein
MVSIINYEATWFPEKWICISGIAAPKKKTASASNQNVEEQRTLV